MCISLCWLIAYCESPRKVEKKNAKTLKDISHNKEFYAFLLLITYWVKSLKLFKYNKFEWVWLIAKFRTRKDHLIRRKMGGGVAKFKKKLLNINRYRQIHSSKDRIALRKWIMVDSSQTYTVKKGPKHG